MLHVHILPTHFTDVIMNGVTMLIYTQHVPHDSYLLSMNNIIAHDLPTLSQANFNQQYV